MKSNYKLFALIFALITLSFLGCKEDGLFGSGGDGDVVPRGEECGSTLDCATVTGARCNNGYCQCPDTTAQLRPGFCIRRELPNTFVTFDKHPEWVDTTMISFNEEPFDTDWTTITGDGKQLGGQHLYNTTRGTWGSAGRLFRPDDPSVNADSIWITPIHTGRFSGSAFFNDGDWRCTKVFMGRFTDRDTIKGRLVFVGCRGGENTPLPDEVTNPTHEMTWVRLH